MGKHDFMTPKAIANRIKAKGLQKLKFYCQTCEKQCRDANGFKCHLNSESHQRQILVVADHGPGRYIHNYSQEFESVFVKILKTRFGTRRVLANMVYQDVIRDRHHIHMNSTRWVTLTEFVKYLGRKEIAEVDETEKGWWVKWIDKSPETLEREEKWRKKMKGWKDEEERERILLENQVKASKKEANGETQVNADEHVLVRKDGDDEPVKLNLVFNATSSSTSQAPKEGQQETLGSSDSTCDQPKTSDIPESTPSAPTPQAKNGISSAFLMAKKADNAKRKSLKSLMKSSASSGEATSQPQRISSSLGRKQDIVTAPSAPVSNIERLKMMMEASKNSSGKRSADSAFGYNGDDRPRKEPFRRHGTYGGR